MPSSIQIVPKYQHSYVESHVNDYTTWEDEVPVVSDDTVKTICVFRSPKGIDNTLVKNTTTTAHIDTFGKTNYKKYGQPLMMPYALLDTENASVWSMRVMPEDATYANSVLLMYYREATQTTTEYQYNTDGSIATDETTGEELTTTTVKPMFQVMYRAKSISPEIDSATNALVSGGEAGITVESAIAKSVASLVSSIPAVDDGNEWKCIPIMYFNSTGRGEYGNMYKWRITRNGEYEKDYEKKMYSFEVLSSEDGTSKIANYVGSLVTQVVSGKSCLLNDVILEYDKGTYPLNMSVFEENVEAVYESYVSFLENVVAADGTEVYVPELSEFDPFFATEVASDVAYEYMTIISSEDEMYPITNDEDYVELDASLGNALTGGHDGSFATTRNADGTISYGPTQLLTEDEIATARNQGYVDVVYGLTTREELEYIKAFSGVKDKLILATRRVPADFILDANYPYFAKLQLVKLAITRNDALCYIDTGVDTTSFSTASLTQLTNKYMDIFSNRIISKNVQAYETRDRWSQKRCVVTPTFYLAQQLPIHFKENGKHVAFAKGNAELTGHVKNSLFPSVELYEGDLMEELYNNRFNFFEATGENTFQRSCQNTGQLANSDLLEESNMHVLLWIKRNVEIDCQRNLYNFANIDDREAFTEYEKAKYADLAGTEVSSFDIYFDMNEWEAERSILHCYISIQFRNINKRTIIEIDVNKRDFLS